MSIAAAPRAHAMRGTRICAAQRLGYDARLQAHQALQRSQAAHDEGASKSDLHCTFTASTSPAGRLPR
eukprot:6183139-Pleurochrysis_carterae.AAC.3